MNLARNKTLNTCCKDEPTFSIFPFYKFHSDNSSARLLKEHYFIHIFDPKLNINVDVNNLWTLFDVNVYFTRRRRHVIYICVRV